MCTASWISLSHFRSKFDVIFSIVHSFTKFLWSVTVVFSVYIVVLTPVVLLKLSNLSKDVERLMSVLHSGFIVTGLSER